MLISICDAVVHTKLEGSLDFALKKKTNTIFIARYARGAISAHSSFLRSLVINLPP